VAPRRSFPTDEDFFFPYFHCDFLIFCGSAHGFPFSWLPASGSPCYGDEPWSDDFSWTPQRAAFVLFICCYPADRSLFLIYVFAAFPFFSLCFVPRIYHWRMA